MDRVCKGLVHVVGQTLHWERLAVHCPWARTVRTWRAVGHEGLRRVWKCFVVTAYVGESRAALHPYVVWVAHRGNVLTMRCLRHVVPSVVVVARLLVVRGLLVVVDIVGVNRLLRNVRVVEFVKKGATRAWWLRVRLVVLLGVVPHLSRSLDSLRFRDDAAVLFAGVVDGGVDSNV